MPLTGIHNVSEFYGHNYFAEIFAGDTSTPPSNIGASTPNPPTPTTF